MDAFYMRKALQLAERGRGTTSPNPMVGALVVDGDGVIVGRGSHEFAGGPHAEVHALRDAGDRARGATLYCTLEPCSHAGRTGPCAPAVADAGIARVVIASEDPNPLARGGRALLRARGVDVTTGILEGDARRLNAPFFTRVTRQRPFVTMKVAVSLDGAIASSPGRRTALTGPSANRLVHRERAEVDAIAVGVGTMLTDDPVLTARGAFRRRPLTRVAIESPAALEASLQALARRDVTSLIVEGGVRLHAAFWDADAVDRVQIYVTPHQLGQGAVKWLPDPVMSSPRIRHRSARPVGIEDVVMEGYVHRVD